MIRNIKNIINKKYFYRVMVTITIAIIIFLIGMFVLKYNIEGETNIPFTISKIAIISSGEGIDKQASDTKWAFDIYQSNDIFLYLDKNQNYGKTEIIRNVKIDNIQINAIKKDNIKIYRPEEQEENVIFKNKEENIVQNLEYIGDMQSNLKQMKISNQGGIIAFRCSNDNLKQFTSNDEEINHQELLKKAEIIKEDLNANITFDLILQLEAGKVYKTTINLDLPVEDVIEKGTTSTEITDLNVKWERLQTFQTHLITNKKYNKILDKFKNSLYNTFKA